jgi:transcriptional regulator with PAS, ATPase and Fis domain
LQDDNSKSEILSEHKRLFNDVNNTFEDSTFEEDDSQETQSTILINSRNEDSEQDYVVEDITHETEDESSLSLEKQEKEMILKALAKNRNKRKYAAQDLGISERTLYRKIKQYEIDSI